MKVRLTLSIVLMSLAFSLTACGSSKAESAGFTDNIGYKSSSASTVNSASGGAVADIASFDGANRADVENLIENITEDSAITEDKTSEDNSSEISLEAEKLVYRCSINIETLTYSETYASIKENIAKYNGIIQEEKETDASYNWYYDDYIKTDGTMSSYIRCRVPSNKYNEFLESLTGSGKIINKTTSVDNISQQYYDATTRIEALRKQEERLLEMMDSATSVEEMISVEDKLTEVQYEIDSLTTDIQYMDMDVAYSYVDIRVDEVMEYKEDELPTKTQTFMDRLKNACRDSVKNLLFMLENMLFALIYALPVIAVVVCIIVVIVLIIRKATKKTRNLPKKDVNNINDNEDNQEIK